MYSIIEKTRKISGNTVIVLIVTVILLMLMNVNPIVSVSKNNGTLYKGLVCFYALNRDRRDIKAYPILDCYADSIEEALDTEHESNTIVRVLESVSKGTVCGVKGVNR